MLRNNAETGRMEPLPGPRSGDEGNERDHVASLIGYLDKTGKVCPRPWCWRRFYILFRPGYEPCWLSAWWETSLRDKKALFHRQLYYLANRTSRYHEASRFLYGLDEALWLHDPAGPVRGRLPA